MVVVAARCDWVVLASAGVKPPLAALLAMVLTLTASASMFYLLVWRATSHARWLALWDWGRERGFWLNPIGRLRAPAPLDDLSSVKVRVRACLSDARSLPARTLLVLMETEARAGLDSPPGGDGTAGDLDPAVSGSGAGNPPGRRKTWHLLIRKIEQEWPAAGARPAHASSSLLDLYPLSSFPQAGANARFVVFASEAGAARRLMRSSARALLPPDIGLLLIGRRLVLDFSARPFDALEFNRMLPLADQLAAHLPTPA